MEWAGKDATAAFVNAGHSVTAFEKKEEFLVGTAEKKSQMWLIVALMTVVLAIGVYFMSV